MTTNAIIPILKSYAELRHAVEVTLIRGQREIDRARLETYWRTGALIDRHLAAGEHDTGYGTQTMRRLARDLKTEASVLYRCLRFARVYPIFAGRRNLLWAHYRLLIDVADSAERRTLELDADRNHWTAEVLETRGRALNAVNVTPAKDTGGSATTPSLLKPQHGTPGVHRVATIDGRRVVDLGFASYLDLSAEQADTFKDGALVQLSGAGLVTAAEGSTKADLFNYRVEIIRVVDGDTLWVRIYLRAGQWVKQKLRLRGLDCPEMSTPEGRAAKRFVEALVARTTAVTINTTKPDKYDRYLADVFLAVDSGEERAQQDCAPTGDIFLNNTLLENGHAVRKDKWEFRDWEPDLIA